MTRRAAQTDIAGLYNYSRFWAAHPLMVKSSRICIWFMICAWPRILRLLKATFSGNQQLPWAVQLSHKNSQNAAARLAVTDFPEAYRNAVFWGLLLRSVALYFWIWSWCISPAMYWGLRAPVAAHSVIISLDFLGKKKKETLSLVL